MANTELPTATTLEYNGKTYRLKPLELGDLLEHAKYHRDMVFDNAKRNMIGLPFELAKYAWDTAKAEAAKIEVGTTEFKNAVLSFEGQIYGLWLSIRHAHPEVALKEVLGMFEADLNAISDKATEVMGYLRPNPTKPLAGPQTTVTAAPST